MNILGILAIINLTLSLPTDPATRAEAYKTTDMMVQAVSVIHHTDLDFLEFRIEVNGVAGKTVPTPNASLHGAPVLAYVFPTTLEPQHVGFQAEEGIVALAVTSHPDFDDTPLWDEGGDRDYGNDGVIWHPHWVILTEDTRVKGGLSVQEIAKEELKHRLPPTNPGMPMYMDSPGFPVITRGNRLSVVVPLYRIQGQRSFRFDAVTAYMQVNTSGENALLGVYDVYSIASGDLSLPYTTTSED